MTEAKYQRMGKLEKFYIEQNWKKLSVQELSKDTNVLVSSVTKFVEKLKAAEDKSSSKSKIMETSVTQINATASMVPRKGVAVMTQTASQISDELRKSVVRPSNSDRVAKIKE